jgi:AP2-associated kinase
LQTGNGGGKAATKVDAFGMPTVAQTDKAAIRKGNASAATGNASKVDAFGMPVSTKTGNIATGNGDASATTGEAGKVDALGMPVGAKNGKVATGNGGASATTGGAGKVDASGMPKAPSLDAFGAPKGANAKLFDRLAPARPTPSFTDSFTGRIPSEATTPILTGIRTASPQPQSASPQKATFETRFPSIEMLDAGNLISPIRSPTEKPPLQAKASMMGNLTGDLAGTHLSVLRADKMPTARSTQVTGTAFKDVKEPEQEVDLMTGDGYQELEDTAKEAPETNEAPETKDSSDEEEPESANAYYPKRSSTLAARRAAFEMPANVETSPIKRRPVSMYARTEEPLSAVSAPAVVEHAAATTAPAAVQKTPIETPTEAKVKPAVKPKPVIKTEPTLDKVPTLDNDKATTLDKVPTLDKPQRVRPEIKPKPSKHGDMPTIHGYSRSSSGRSFPISRPVGSPEKRPVSPEKKPIEMGSPDKRQSVNSLIAKWGGK